MKFAILLVVVAVVVAKPLNEKLKSLNVPEIVDNDRLLEGYGKCMTNEGKCTPEGKEIRDIIPEAVQNECAECDEPDMQKIAIFINALEKKFPEIYGKLVKAYATKEDDEERLKQFVQKHLN